MKLVWSSELEIGIPVIDSQHERIVDYINQVEHSAEVHSREELLDVINELVEYTLSHFTFEESLMEEAGYPYVKAHSKVHKLFTRRVSGIQQRAGSGEDVTDELLKLLKTWLVNHIKRDDRDYSHTVKENMAAATERVKKKEGSWLKRLFG